MTYLYTELAATGIPCNASPPNFLPGARRSGSAGGPVKACIYLSQGIHGTSELEMRFEGPVFKIKLSSLIVMIWQFDL